MGLKNGNDGFVEYGDDIGNKGDGYGTFYLMITNGDCEGEGYRFDPSPYDGNMV